MAGMKAAARQIGAPGELPTAMLLKLKSISKRPRIAHDHRTLGYVPACERNCAFLRQPIIMDLECSTRLISIFAARRTLDPPLQVGVMSQSTVNPECESASKKGSDANPMMKPCG
jgi:hypothetical protein